MHLEAAHAKHTTMVRIALIPTTHALDVILAATVVPEQPTLTVFLALNTPQPHHTAHASVTHTGLVRTAEPAPSSVVSVIRNVTDVAAQLLLNVSRAQPTLTRMTLDNVSVMTIITVMIVLHSNKMPDTTQSVTPSVLVAVKEELHTTVMLVLTTPHVMPMEDVNVTLSGLVIPVILTPTLTPRLIHAIALAVAVLALLNSTALSVSKTHPKTCTESVDVTHTGTALTVARILLTAEDATLSAQTVLAQLHTIASAVYQALKETCTAPVNANHINLVMTVALVNHSPVTPSVVVKVAMAQQSVTV